MTSSRCWRKFTLNAGDIVSRSGVHGIFCNFPRNSASEDARVQGDSSRNMHVCASICEKQKQFNVKFKLHQVLFDALTETMLSFFCVVCPRLFN